MGVRGFSGDLGDLQAKAAQVSNMMSEYRKGIRSPDISFTPSQYDLTGNSKIVEALQEQREENARLSRNNTRLTYLSIFLAAIPVIFGLWSLYQSQKSNELMERQLDQFQILIERTTPEEKEPVYGPSLP